jgi:glucokinase
MMAKLMIKKPNPTLFLDEQLALGFDIGGTKTKLGLVNRKGKILAYQEIPTSINSSSIDSFMSSLFDEIHHLLELANYKVIGIGATFLGWIDEARTGPFLCLNAPALHGVNLRKRLNNEFRLPIVLNDDATAHALAEFTFGSGRGVRRFMTIAMGTGLGVAVIIDGHSLKFTGGCVGDAGHIILRPGGRTCSSGCKGCAEALIGVSGIEHHAFEKYGYKKHARELITGARDGTDTIAISVIEDIGVLTGELLASLSHIFLPERIALIGGTSRAGTFLLEAAKNRFEYLVGDYHRTFSQLSNGYYSGVEIVLGELRGETGVIGSVIDLFEIHDKY